MMEMMKEMNTIKAHDFVVQKAKGFGHQPLRC